MINMQTDIKLLSDYLSRTVSDKIRLISILDRKANIMLVLIGVVLSLFFNTFFLNRAVNAMQALIIITPFIVSGYFAFLTLYPRTRKTNEIKSLINYQTARNANLKEWEKIFDRDAEKVIINDYISNIKALSQIIQSKIRVLKLSYGFLAIAILIKIIIEFPVYMNL